MTRSSWDERAAPDPGRPISRRRWAVARPAELTSARRALRADLAAGPLPAGADADDVDRLLLAFEELTSNGLRHSGAPIEVTVTSSAGGWLVEVSDARPDQPPVPAVDRDPALGGLGLHLIARLSSSHGWSVAGRRKLVWAHLTPAACA
jgi:anti-sigma regulatory factor (Ser/Thr protein kinase)